MRISKRLWVPVSIAFVIIAVGTMGVLFYAHSRTSGYALQMHECGKYEEAAKEQCYEKLIMDTAHARGISAALDVIAELYASDQQFTTYCHGNTHELGDVAYKQFEHNGELTLSEKTSYCGFGFYHGFMEALLADKGSLSEARRFCEYVDNKLSSTMQGISYACYHGIGHGVVDGTDPRTWGDQQKFIAPGLALCDQLGDNLEHQTRCASGVFNSLAIAYRDPKYKLDPDPKDPYKICRKQEKQYARKACYDQMNTYVFVTNQTFKDALLVAAKAEPQYRELAVQTVAGFASLAALSQSDDLIKFIDDCNVLSADLADKCVFGFASGAIEFGKPGHEYDRPLTACIESATHSTTCLRGLTLSVRDRLKPDVQKRLCSDIQRQAGAHAGSECVNDIQAGS